VDLVDDRVLVPKRVFCCQRSSPKLSGLDLTLGGLTNLAPVPRYPNLQITL
jgi:hypothetical protein